MTRTRLVATIALVLLVPAGVWLGLVILDLAPRPGEPIFPPFNLSDRLSQLQIEETPEGVWLVYDGDTHTEYTAEEFLREVKRRQDENRGLRFVFSVLDITSWTGMFWVMFGFTGQALFMGRMLAQWIASERVRLSVVPPVFWWLSLLGSTMLMIYFVWRKEIVGFVGQSTGWVIYVRNLWFIYGAPRAN